MPKHSYSYGCISIGFKLITYHHSSFSDVKLRMPIEGEVYRT